jgi:23S rRNA (cytidine2498-2'-O)-methyltransferase
MEEALRWSRLAIEKGDLAVEIGCAPGGACQALLSRGLVVTGVDPALVHPTVADHPNFVQIRKRGADVRRREFQGFSWLFADMNVAPSYTLDTVESIVSHRQSSIRGLLLTLKLLDWKLADEVPAYLARIRAWGYPYVRARQLQHNRQEICVVALKQRPRPKKVVSRKSKKARDRSTENTDEHRNEETLRKDPQRTPMSTEMNADFRSPKFDE